MIQISDDHWCAQQNSIVLLGINGRTAVGIVLRDMRRAASFPTACNEVGGIIVLVAADCTAWFGIVFNHVECGGTLGRTVGICQPRIDDERVAILHHQMPHIAELGLFTGGFAEQPSIGVGGRGMRVVPALFAMEVAFRIAPAASATAFARRRLAALLRHEALHAGPRLNQRAVDREMLAGEQGADLRQVLGRFWRLEETIMDKDRVAGSAIDFTLADR